MPYSNLDTEATVGTLVEKMGLTNLTPEIDPAQRALKSYMVYRPALQLTGFLDVFGQGPHERIQIIGRMEQNYINTLSPEDAYWRFEKLASFNIPCVIFARNYMPGKGIMDACRKYSVPVLLSSRGTSELTSEATRWLRVLLAPKITLPGVLVDVYGEGVLIQGDSGIGKSEAALELIKRGHRFVSDDAVEIRKVSDDTLVGRAPNITRDFIELRGIGVINVRAMFGYEAIKQTQNIDMLINLSEYDPTKNYDRLGFDHKYTELLGNQVITYDIPMRLGRNIAVIVECAALNNRAIKMGWDVSQEFIDRVNKNIRK